VAIYLATSVGGPQLPDPIVPDATSSDDALDILKSFLTGTAVITAPNTALPVGEQWFVEDDDTTSVPGERFLYLRGPGLAASDNIYVNIRRFEIPASNVISWQIRGAEGYDSGDTFDTQAGSTDIDTYLTLDNNPTPFWIIANGRRFICIFKVSTIFVALYGGFILPYATSAEFSYPLLVGANTGEVLNVFGTTDYTMGNFYDGPFNASGSLIFKACGSMRSTDGQWRGVGSYSGDDVSARPTFSTGDLNGPVVGWPHDATPGADDAYQMTKNINNSGLPGNESTSVMPFILYSDSPSNQIYGEFDGVFFTPKGDLVTEDTVTIGPDTYLIIQNTYRPTESNVAFLLA